MATALLSLTATDPVWKENDVLRIIPCTGISLVHSLVHKQSGNPIVGAQNFSTLVGSQNICKNNAFYANLDVNTLFFLYKNKFYKNIEAQNRQRTIEI